MEVIRLKHDPATQPQIPSLRKTLQNLWIELGQNSSYRIGEFVNGKTCIDVFVEQLICDVPILFATDVSPEYLLRVPIHAGLLRWSDWTCGLTIPPPTVMVTSEEPPSKNRHELSRILRKSLVALSADEPEGDPIDGIRFAVLAVEVMDPSLNHKRLWVAHEITQESCMPVTHWILEVRFPPAMELPSRIVRHVSQSSFQRIAL